ncbi:MAG: adenylyltransferase/cytidyltransferase family protein [Dissulfurispiraceae bacterium]
MKIRVVCAGTFDFLHLGHLEFLRQAKSLGDDLIVIVARDETVKRIKGFIPTHNEQLRKQNVEQTRIPDSVILGNLGADLFQVLRDLAPDIIALGYDQRVSEHELSERFPECKIIRLRPFQPEKYKSSFFRDAR